MKSPNLRVKQSVEAPAATTGPTFALSLLLGQKLAMKDLACDPTQVDAGIIRACKAEPSHVFVVHQGAVDV